MYIDQCRINLTFNRPNTSNTAVINIGQEYFKVSATCLTTPPILITFLTETRMLYMTSHSFRCWTVGTSTKHHTKFRVSHNSDAHLQPFVYISRILLCCCKCWLTGSVKSSKIYVWYTPTATEKLLFHHEFGRRRTR